MGHNIEYYDYPESYSKEKIFTGLSTHVAHATWQEGGHGLKEIRWNDHVCDSYEDAKAWIEAHDRKWYDCLAVKYKEPVKDNSKKVEELKNKVAEAGALYHQRSGVLYPRTRMSEYIGCSKCGSKLSQKYLNSNYCPLCHEDLRPDTMKKSIESARIKWQKAEETYKEYVKKHGKKTICWLVKIEYHT